MISWRKVAPQRGNIYKEIEKKLYAGRNGKKKFLQTLNKKGAYFLLKKYVDKYR